ncbi:hypothetical protein M0R72_17520 [Candidatus Pacearchaeota archaeon]|jgi:hypothetical protein|nr:hypothetical protein [Candidatus Pacearchaeota archaeon]
MPFIRTDKVLSADDLRFLVECVWPLDGRKTHPCLGRPKTTIEIINGVRVRYCECGVQIEETQRLCEPCRRARRELSYKRYYASHREERLEYVRKRRAA